MVGKSSLMVASGRRPQMCIRDSDKGNKVGNPFKSSLFGKSAGYEAVQRKFIRSKSEIKDRKLADMTKRTVLSVLQGTYDKDKFVSQLKEKGIDTVLRYTDEGRIYGATFIDHRTGCVLNGSRMGKELSANALQEHFTLPYAGQPPIPLSIPMDAADKAYGQKMCIRDSCSADSRVEPPVALLREGGDKLRVAHGLCKGGNRSEERRVGKEGVRSPLYGARYHSSLLLDVYKRQEYQTEKDTF